MADVSGVTLSAAAAAGCFTFEANVIQDETATIGAITYTFRNSPASAYEVDVGGDADTSIQNLVDAINGDLVGTDAHPYVTATADLANDEIDLVARIPGDFANHIGLSAVGSSSIAAAATSLGAVAGGTDGAGDLSDWANGLLDHAQLQSDVIAELRNITRDAD